MAANHGERKQLLCVAFSWGIAASSAVRAVFGGYFDLFPNDKQWYERGMGCFVELEVNLTALYTECDDQSSWYYMRTLFTIIQELVEKNILPQSEGEKLLNERIEAIKELLEVEPDCIYGDRFLNELIAVRM